MVRRYTPGASSSGAPRLTPSPTPQGPRAGIQVVTARKPRTGPSAAEEIDGPVRPIDLAEGLTLDDLPPRDDSTLSNGSRQHAVIQGSCCFCGHTEEDDVLVLAPGPLTPDAAPELCSDIQSVKHADKASGGNDDA